MLYGMGEHNKYIFLSCKIQIHLLTKFACFIVEADRGAQEGFVLQVLFDS